jgi:hypothetical protein
MAILRNGFTSFFLTQVLGHPQATVYERPKSKTEALALFVNALQRAVKRLYARTQNAFRRIMFPSTPMSLYALSRRLRLSPRTLSSPHQP